MITFRLFTEEDIEKVVSWIFEPHVFQVWDSAQGVSRSELINKYKKRVQFERESIEMYIININGIDVGYIQTYYIDNQNDFGFTTEICKGIDLFIGDKAYINKGWGTKVLSKFIKSHVFFQSNVQYACIDPELYNERAIRAYEKVGFEITRIAFSDYSKLLTCYMVLEKDS